MKSDFQDPAQDPRLTAYALGELTDPKEIEAVESLLRGSPALRREVESLQATAELIQLELEQEPCPSLAPHQLASLGEPPRSGGFWAGLRPGNRSWWVPAGLATAAAVVVMVSAAILFLQETEEPPLSAGLQRPEPVVGEIPTDLKRITKEEQAHISPGPRTTAPPQSSVQPAPEPSKTASPAPPAAQDSSGPSLPVPAETAVVLENPGDSPESGTSLVSMVGPRVIDPGEIPGSRVVNPGEVPGSRIVEIGPGALPEGIFEERHSLRERSQMFRRPSPMPPSVVPFSPSVTVRRQP